MNEKFKKLQAHFNKQVREIGLFVFDDFDIQVEGGLINKFKMPDLPIVQGIKRLI